MKFRREGHDYNMTKWSCCGESMVTFMRHAEAVRAGVRYLCKYTHADFIGFWDADLATPLDEAPRFIDMFETFPQTRIVIGSRWPHLGADIQRTVCRGFAGAIVKLIIRFALGVPVCDT